MTDEGQSRHERRPKSRGQSGVEFVAVEGYLRQAEPLEMPDDVRNRIAHCLDVGKIRRPTTDSEMNDGGKPRIWGRRNRWGTYGAAAAAVILVGSLIGGVLHAKNRGMADQGQKVGDTRNGYGTWPPGSYQKTLGFTPMLPSTPPANMTLAGTVVSSYFGITGKQPDFTATYTSREGGKSAFALQIYEEAGHDTSFVAQHYRKLTTKGTVVYEATSSEEMEKFVTIAGGVIYGVTNGSGVSDTTAEQVLLDLNHPVTTAPTEVAVSFNGVADASRALSFTPVIPSYVPPGFVRESVYGASVKSQQTQLRDDITMLYQSQALYYHVEEGRFGPPQPSAAPSVTGIAHQTTVKLARQPCTVTTYSVSRGVVISWTDPSTGVWYRVGSAAAPEDSAVLRKVMASIITQALGQ